MDLARPVVHVKAMSTWGGEICLRGWQPELIVVAVRSAGARGAETPSGRVIGELGPATCTAATASLRLRVHTSVPSCCRNDQSVQRGDRKRGVSTVGGVDTLTRCNLTNARVVRCDSDRRDRDRDRDRARDRDRCARPSNHHAVHAYMCKMHDFSTRRNVLYLPSGALSFVSPSCSLIIRSNSLRMK
jgi:hypothetical protein